MMKQLVASFLSLIIAISLGCASRQEEKVEEMALRVEGMVCEYGCARYIEKKVASLSGVKECLVSFEENIARISFNSREISADEIKSVIAGLNEGQYKVRETDVPEKPHPDTGAHPGNERSGDSKAKVSFRFPQLVTYFMEHFVR